MPKQNVSEHIEHCNNIACVTANITLWTSELFTSTDWVCPIRHKVGHFTDVRPRKCRKGNLFISNILHKIQLQWKKHNSDLPSGIIDNERSRLSVPEISVDDSCAASTCGATSLDPHGKRRTSEDSRNASTPVIASCHNHHHNASMIMFYALLVITAHTFLYYQKTVTQQEVRNTIFSILFTVKKQYS